jgi:hypothetical protein
VRLVVFKAIVNAPSSSFLTRPRKRSRHRDLHLYSSRLINRRRKHRDAVNRRRHEVKQKQKKKCRSKVVACVFRLTSSYIPVTFLQQKTCIDTRAIPAFAHWSSETCRLEVEFDRRSITTMRRYVGVDCGLSTHVKTLQPLASIWMTCNIIGKPSSTILTVERAALTYILQPALRSTKRRSRSHAALACAIAYGDLVTWCAGGRSLHITSSADAASYTADLVLHRRDVTS